MYIDNLADVFRLKGELDRAVRTLEKSLKLNTRGITTQFTLGKVYKDLKEYEKSIEAFKKSLKVNTSLYEAHYHIAQIQLEQKNLDSALKSIESAIKFAPTNKGYRELREKILAS